MYLAEDFGAMEVLLDTTAANTRARKQCGVPISFFREVRHCLADMYIAYRKANNLFSQKLRNGHDRRIDAGDIALLKAQLRKSTRCVGEQSIQFHGGIGVPDQFWLGHYFKRLMAVTALWGRSSCDCARSVYYKILTSK